MVKKPEHPDTELFDYVRGSLDAEARRSIERHLTECDECSTLSSLVQTLKSVSSKLIGEDLDPSQKSQEHPSVGELASFFYDAPSQDSSHVAAHVAVCNFCAEAIAQYAGAERAASEYDAARPAMGEVPASAWEMIREWEESSFATLKPASEVLSRELLEGLSKLVKAREHAPLESRHMVSGSQAPELVPVLVINRSGEVHSVEYFHEESDATGARVLRHVDGSERFDNRAVHMVLDAGENEPLVVSNMIHRDTIRFEEEATPRTNYGRADYIIIED